MMKKRMDSNVNDRKGLLNDEYETKLSWPIQ